MNYIKLDAEKTPIEKLSDGGHPLTEVEDFDNLGVLIPEPLVVFDFDSPSDAEIILNIVEELDIHCNVMKTTRGVHIWFKSDDPIKNVIKNRCAIGLYYDVRSWGKLSFVVVKKDGEWREWLRTYKPEELDSVPIWLKPLHYGKFKFKGMGDGDGRNQALYEYILVLQQKGFTREQIRKTIKIINSFVFDEPLADYEIETILRDDSFKPDDEVGTDNSSYFNEDGKFKHNIFANASPPNTKREQISLLSSFHWITPLPQTSPYQGRTRGRRSQRERLPKPCREQCPDRDRRARDRIHSRRGIRTSLVSPPVFSLGYPNFLDLLLAHHNLGDEIEHLLIASAAARGAMSDLLNSLECLKHRAEILISL